MATGQWIQSPGFPSEAIKTCPDRCREMLEVTGIADLTVGANTVAPWCFAPLVITLPTPADQLANVRASAVLANVGQEANVNGFLISARCLSDGSYQGLAVVSNQCLVADVIRQFALDADAGLVYDMEAMVTATQAIGAPYLPFHWSLSVQELNELAGI